MINGLKRQALCFLLLAAAGLPLWAQNAGGTSLASELDRLEKSALTPAQKNDALAGLGRLYRLSGSREQAAQAYAEAARADPARLDGVSLLEALKLYISLGEYEKAEAGLGELLSVKGMNEAVLSGARLLKAELDAFKTGDIRALAVFAGDPAYSFRRSGIYYTLWRVSGEAAWKTRLLAEYPQSPEALTAAGAAGINLAASPQWLLFPGREAVVLEAPASGGQAAARPETASGGTPGTTVLQTGLFGKEENARAMAARLSGAGFSPRIVRRRVRDSEYWAVTVPAADLNKTIMELKNAGFESFPVFE